MSVFLLTFCKFTRKLEYAPPGYFNILLNLLQTFKSKWNKLLQWGEGDISALVKRYFMWHLKKQTNRASECLTRRFE